MDIPFIEQAKIQAQVLVPLLKTLQAELGEERANAIVNKAIGEFYRKLGQEWWQTLVVSCSNIGLLARCSTDAETLRISWNYRAVLFQ